MKAIQVYQFGGPEVLALHAVPTPKPGPGEVLVRVRAAGVNPYDTYMRNGSYPVKPALPYTPGSDAAGTIETVGGGVTKVKPGDRVYTPTTLTRAYAEYALARENQVYPLPEKISFSQGAGLWVPYGTAYTALRHHADARAGETLLVHGASGGVGIAAVQWARALGLTVIGTAGTPRGLDLVKKEGAHHVFDHTKAGYPEEILKATGGRGGDLMRARGSNVILPTEPKMLARPRIASSFRSVARFTINPRE